MTRRRSVIEYYSSFGSRYGYALVLGGTKHFGLYAKADSRWKFADAMRRMEDLLARKIDLPTGSVVLDAGCGVGDVACRLAAVHGYCVTGIDILDFNITDARRRAFQRGTSSMNAFQVMSYDRLEFPAETFDAVYTMETLVHAEDAQLVLTNFFNVLKPGAKLVLFEYSHDKELTPFEREALQRVNDLASMPSFQRFEVGVLDKLIGDAGFQDVSREDITDQMEPMFRSFAEMARIPYGLSRLIGKPDLFVNAMSAAELWKVRNSLHYCIYTAQKPMTQVP